jgi:O-acetyl-ADP-ribose deacetylase (regulator of RNase III)
VIELVLGDITEQRVDAIVNAANASILEECRRLGGCEAGDVKATAAGDLQARHVLHAVGPIWRGGTEGEPELLATCHRRAIELADELGCRSVAFPAISTGAYGYPVELAAPVAIEATRAALEAHPGVELARFVFRDEPTLAPYRSAANRV